jgi:2-amino-4-hydroxy-6-hydroxymethyldihydropteridine diphosphokinase
MPKTSYAIALGSNRRTPKGSPEATLRAVMRTLEAKAESRIVSTAAMGAAVRRFANAAVIVRSKLEPPEMLAELKAIERKLGRRRGRRWGDRPIDLDIVLWSEGPWVSPGLLIPHPAFRQRDFVLRPLVTIARDWRDPMTGLSVGQLRARLTRRRPASR